MCCPIYHFKLLLVKRGRMPGESGVTRSYGNGRLSIPNVAVFLDGGIGWVPLPVVTTGTMIRRHTVFVLREG